MYDILELDEQAMTVRVEPMVTIGDITEHLIPRGYSLAVCIELTDATLGGAYKKKLVFPLKLNEIEIVYNEIN